MNLTLHQQLAGRARDAGIRLFRPLAHVLGLCGLMLLIINVVGLFVPLRRPHVTSGATYFGETDLTLSPKEVLSLSQRQGTEPTINLVTRATRAVNQGMAHDWPQPIPPTENWLLWLIGLKLGEGSVNWELTDYKKALERGSGLCSQHAIVLEGLLEDQGVHTQIVSLGLLHVVNRIEVDERQWVIADPDYGVVLPDLTDITPEIIRAAYSEPVQTARVEPIPGYPDLMSYLLAAYEEPVRIAASSTSYNSIAASTEYWTYQYQWYIPIFMLIPYRSLIYPGGLNECSVKRI